MLSKCVLPTDWKRRSAISKCPFLHHTNRVCVCVVSMEGWIEGNRLQSKANRDQTGGESGLRRYLVVAVHGRKGHHAH